MDHQIAVEPTAQRIIDWANKAPLGRGINIKTFNEEINGPDAQSFLKEACEFCNVEPVYG